MNIPLEIDAEFEAMCPPLTTEEFKQLEENIILDGIFHTPLIIWNGTIIDGHNRYRIAQAHPDIGYCVHEMSFDNRFAALSWICRNQLGRRNLTPQQKKYLIGQQYEAEKNSEQFHGNQHTLANESGGDEMYHHQKSRRTRARIADETNTSEAYVQHASRYAKGIDAAEEVLPGIKQEILTGTIKPTEIAIAAVAKAAPEERRQKAEALRRPKRKPKPAARDEPSPVDMSTEMSPCRTAHQNLQDVREIYAAMTDDNTEPVTEDSILETLHGAVIDMIRVCETLFMDFPRLLSDKTYKAKVIAIMQEPKDYIYQLEGDRT